MDIKWENKSRPQLFLKILKKIQVGWLMEIKKKHPLNGHPREC